ncbi:hypothetical protein ACOME3_009374 [Neoechinorhynchus agilis]
MSDGDKASKRQVGPVVMRRVNALRQLQLETVKIQTRMYEEVFQLEKRCAEELKSIHKRRLAIVSGNYEPSEQESQCSIPFDEDACIVEDQMTIDDYKGIPQFWLHALMNAPAFDEMIRSHDEAVLAYLTDITCEYDEIKEVVVESPNGVTKTERMSGFTLHFHFAPNEFFTNTVLTKSYTIRLNPDSESPFQYGGPEITGCGGCEINWKPGKNVTVRTVRKKVRRQSQKDAPGGLVTKEIAQDSFFMFFKNPTGSTDEDEDDGVNELLEDHFDLGHFLCDKLIPDAILFYTGESDDMYDYEGEDDDDEQDSQSSSDDSESFNIDIPRRSSRNGSSNPQRSSGHGPEF